MFRDPHAFHLASGTPIAPPTSSVAGAPVAPPAVAPAPPPVAPAPAAAPSAAAPTAAAPPVAAPGAAPTAAAPAAAVPAAPAPAPAAAAPPPKPVAEAPAPAEATKPTHAEAKAPAEPKARSYEQLVADGDRSLENGQTAKAQKLYDDALRQQPGGVAALTGSAYVLLDRRHPLAAIGVFKQVLGNAPHYAPALFGLGEAYRGQGDAAQAIDAYKQYLEQSPTGTDAPAARRQIKDLSEAAATPRNQGPSAVVPAEGAAPTP
jgi:tetratricopeptide (TPR) repeat protein